VYSLFLLFGVEIKSTRKTKLAYHLVPETKVPASVLQYQEQILVTIRS